MGVGGASGGVEKLAERITWANIRRANDIRNSGPKM